MTTNTETFVYATYIRTTPEKLWEALTSGDITRKYWRVPGNDFGNENVSDWKPGSRWEHRKKDQVHVVGRVIESVPPHCLVLTWAHPAETDNKDKVSRVTFDIESQGDVVKLTVTHEYLESGSDMHKGISVGWPVVIASLKTFLETGQILILTKY